MHRLHPLLLTLLLPAGALLSGCQLQPSAPQGVAAQLSAFETQVAPLQAAVEAQLRGEPSGLDAASAGRLTRLRNSLGERAAGLRVAERVQLVAPGEVQRATPELRGLMVLSLPAQTETGLTWAATLTLDLKAGAVLESVTNSDLRQRYQSAQAAYTPHSGAQALLRFVAGTLGVYPPRVSLGTLSAAGKPLQAQAAAQDTAAVAEYAPDGELLSVR
jgi:hypothetical protein